MRQLEYDVQAPELRRPEGLQLCTLSFVQVVSSIASPRAMW
jgi:hypothetical protein